MHGIRRRETVITITTEHTDSKMREHRAASSTFWLLVSLAIAAEGVSNSFSVPFIPVFPPLTSLSFGQHVWENSSVVSTLPTVNPCQTSMAVPSSRRTQILSGDTWEILSIFSNQTVSSLYRFNHFDEASAEFTPPVLIVGTWITIFAPPSVAPQCACPPTYPFISEDTLFCTMDSDPWSSSVRRVAPLSYLPAFMTANIIDAYADWIPVNASLFSDVYINLTILSELSTINIAFVPSAPIPKTVIFYTVEMLNLITSRVDTIPSSSWIPMVVVSSQCATLVPSFPSTPCYANIDTYNNKAAILELPFVPSSSGAEISTSNFKGNIVRARIYRDTMQKLPFKVRSM